MSRSLVWKGRRRRQFVAGNGRRRDWEVRDGGGRGLGQALQLQADLVVVNAMLTRRVVTPRRRLVAPIPRVGRNLDSRHRWEHQDEESCGETAPTAVVTHSLRTSRAPRRIKHPRSNIERTICLFFRGPLHPFMHYTPSARRVPDPGLESPLLHPRLLGLGSSQALNPNATPWLMQIAEPPHVEQLAEILDLRHTTAAEKPVQALVIRADLGQVLLHGRLPHRVDSQNRQ